MKNKNLEDIYDLSPLQRGFLFQTLYAPRAGVYFEQLSCCMGKHLVVPAFERAWQHLIQRHPILRTAFYWQDIEKPLQVVYRKVDLPIIYYDWQELSEDEQQRCLSALLEEDRQYGFTLDSPPLMRLTLIRLNSEQYRFIWSYHHLLLDGWSVSLLLNELFQLYRMLKEAIIPALPRRQPYRTYIAWLRQQNMQEAEKFWRQRLKNYRAPVRLDIDRMPGSLPSQRNTYKESVISLPEELTTALQSFARVHQLTLNTLIQGMWALLLQRYSGQQDIVFGNVVSGRPASLPQAESIIGLFINTLPVRVTLPPTANLVTWLRELQQQQVEAREFEYSPLMNIRGWSELPAGVPLFESVLVFQNYPLDETLIDQLGELAIQDVHLLERTNYPLTVLVVPRSQLQVVLIYDTQRFRAEAIAQLLVCLQSLLASMCRSSAQTLSEIEIVSSAALAHMLHRPLQTEEDYPREKGLAELFEAQAEATPEAVAVRSPQGQMTYGTLNRYANAVAWRLRQEGTGPERLVGVLATRGVSFLVAILGTFKVGSAYLPLDPGYPEERLREIIQRSGVSLLLVESSLQARLQRIITATEDVRSPHVLLLDELFRVAALCEEKSAQRSSPQNLAYVIYTSGSTGKPKGVMVEQQGMINHLYAKIRELQLQPASRVAQTASTSFDISVWQLLAALLVGGSVHILDDQTIADPWALLTAIEHEGISVVEIVPSLLGALLEAGSVHPEKLPSLASLHWLILTGEALMPALCRQWFTFYPMIPLLNAYGPTECSDDVTQQSVPEPPSAGVVHMPIGHPLANTSIYILDKGGQLLPPGVQGEMYIGGDGVGRGYFHDPERTAQVFLPDPFTKRPGRRMYRTGDIGRVLEDGTIEYLGRSDQQVKIRGFRIELGEIEATLTEHPDIKEATVVVQEGPEEGKYLVAYVVPYRQFFEEEEPAGPGDERKTLLLVEAQADEKEIPHVSSFSASVNRPLHQLFEEQVERTPDAVALVLGEHSLSYAMLNERANQVAHLLQARGVGPEVLVGVCMERSLVQILSVLGILKAGGAYVPLDPRYPPEHLKYMMRDSQLALLLADQSLSSELLLPDVPVIFLDRCWTQVTCLSIHNPLCQLSQDHLAYTIYTSGSTGQPKGVLVSHRGLANVLAAQRATFAVGPGDHVLQFASLSFDASVFEIVMSLLTGASLFLGSPAPLVGPDLLRFLRERAITIATLPPSTLAVLSPEPLPDLKTFVVAGETCPANLVNSWGRNRRFFNAYGLTEATIWSSVALCQPDEPRQPPIGRAIQGVELYILNEDGESVPEGVAGELYIGGISLARGYLRRPELTAERFIPHPWSAEPGARLYRTGDRVCRRADGDIECLGRFDEQVKLRGYRIELGEIEACLRRCAEVQEAAVIVREDTPGHKQLVAYVVWNGQVRQEEEETQIQQVRRYIEAHLPAYMLPAVFVSLPEMPLTVSRKIDRRSLPMPDPCRHPGETIFLPPRTPLESLLANLWGEVLNLERVGREDNFFLSGGDSLLGTQVVSRLSSTLGVEVPLRVLFEAPTIREMAVCIEERAVRPQEAGYPPILPAKRDGDLALSFAQQRLWFLYQLDPHSAAYNNLGALRLRGVFNYAAFARGLQEMVCRHEALRTTFDAIDGNPVQIISPMLPLVFPVIDLSSLPSREREAEVQSLLRAEGQRPFDLARGPLFRLYALRLSRQEHIIPMTMHHIISDGWSLQIVVREQAALYNAFCQGQPSPLRPLRIQYADFVTWQREWIRRGGGRDQLHYWKQQLAGAPELLELPTDRPRPSFQTFRGATLTDRLSAEITSKLRSLSRAGGLTLFMSVLAAFQTLLYRYTGRPDIVVGTPVANRNRTEIEGVMGFFVNTVVLRTRLEGNLTFRQVLDRVREVALGAYAHQDFPFDQLVDELRPRRDLSYSPLFQVMFILQNVPWTLPTFNGLELEPFSIDNGIANFDLTISLYETDDELLIQYNYSTDLFDEATISLFMQRFRSLFVAITDDPGQHIDSIAIVPALERRLARSVRDTQETNSTTPSSLEARVSIDNLRAFLSTRLPHYMLPAAFVVLEALPLTANGKVDQQALPRLLHQQQESSNNFVAPRDIYEFRLAHLWEELLGIHAVGAKDNFFEAGGHSLLAMRLISRIQKVFQVDMPLHMLFQHPVLEDLAHHIRCMDVPAPPSALVTLQEKGEKVPFFCVHPVGGSVFCYTELAGCLDRDRPCYALQSLALETGKHVHRSIEEMAKHYMQEILAIQPQGPYLLGGWSMGGLIAFEIGRQLQQEKREVGLVVLLDSWAPDPAYFAQHPPAEIHASRLIEDFAFDLMGRLGKSEQFPLTQLRSGATEEEQLTYLVEQGKKAEIFPPDTELDYIVRLFHTFTMNTRAMYSYVSRRSPLRLALFRAEEHLAEENTAEVLNWEKLTSIGIDRYVVQGSHHTILTRPYVQALAERLNECLDSVHI